MGLHRLGLLDHWVRLHLRGDFSDQEGESGSESGFDLCRDRDGVTFWEGYPVDLGYHEGMEVSLDVRVAEYENEQVKGRGDSTTRWYWVGSRWVGLWWKVVQFEGRGIDKHSLLLERSERGWVVGRLDVLLASRLRLGRRCAGGCGCR